MKHLIFAFVLLVLLFLSVGTALVTISNREFQYRHSCNLRGGVAVVQVGGDYACVIPMPAPSLGQ